MRRLLLLALAGWVMLSILAGELLLSPPRVAPPPAEALRGAHVEPLSLELDGARVSGWICTPAGAPARGSVVLVHGLGSARRLGDHQALLDRGWRVLSVDTRGHGASSGTVGFGWTERVEVGALLRLAEERWPGEPLVGWGRSQGAAALLYALDERARAGDPLRPCALILESCYADIHAAFDNRLEIFAGSRWWRAGAVLLERWVVARAGLVPERMRPVELLPDGVPLLLARGAADPLVDDAEWARWLAAAPHAQTVLVPRTPHMPLVGRPLFDKAAEGVLATCGAR